MTNVARYLGLCIIAGTIGCTGTKNITSNDPLFLGNEYVLVDGNTTAKRAVQQADGRLQPKPNNRFLWMRPALARFNMISDSARQKKFWKSKIAKPVLLSQSQPGLNSRALQNRIYHNGFFHNTIGYDTLRINKKKAKYQYTITLKQPYRFGTIAFPTTDDSLSMKIARSQDETLLKNGEIYSLETIKNERTRISQFLKQHGYIYFNPEFIFLQADTVTEDHLVNVQIRVKANTPPESRTAHTIDRLYVYDNYSLDSYSPDTLNLDPHFFLSTKRDLKHQAIMRGLFLEPGKLYSSLDHAQTIRYLNNLSIIRSTSLRYAEGSGDDKLDAHLFMTKKNSLLTLLNSIPSSGQPIILVPGLFSVLLIGMLDNVQNN